MNAPDGVTQADAFRAKWSSLVHKLGTLEHELDDDRHAEVLGESLDQIDAVIDAAAEEIEDRGGS